MKLPLINIIDIIKYFNPVIMNNESNNHHVYISVFEMLCNQYVDQDIHAIESLRTLVLRNICAIMAGSVRGAQAHV